MGVVSRSLGRTKVRCSDGRDLAFFSIGSGRDCILMKGRVLFRERGSMALFLDGGGLGCAVYFEAAKPDAEEEEETVCSCYSRVVYA